MDTKHRPKWQRTLLKAFLWLLVLSNLAAIYFFSAQQGEESARLSSQINERLVRWLVPGFDSMGWRYQREIRLTWAFRLRKAAHFLIFACLAFLLSLALAQHRIKLSLRLISTLLLAALAAGFDEYHQSLVPGRGPSWMDVLIDCAGAAFGLLLSLNFSFVRKGIKREKEEAVVVSY